MSAEQFAEKDALCPCGDPEVPHAIAGHTQSERLLLAIFGDETTQHAIEVWTDTDRGYPCGQVEVQGFDVVMECIRPAHHDPDYHQTVIGQRWSAAAVNPPESSRS